MSLPVASRRSSGVKLESDILQPALATRGAEFPIVAVRFHLPQASLVAPTLDCDLEVQFAGNTAQYSHVTFRQTVDGTSHHITGAIPSTLADFKIQPPTFLTVPIKNEIPVRVDMTWHPS
jgi:hypothetical protein